MGQGDREKAAREMNRQREMRAKPEPKVVPIYYEEIPADTPSSPSLESRSPSLSPNQLTSQLRLAACEIALQLNDHLKHQSERERERDEQKPGKPVPEKRKKKRTGSRCE